MALGAGTFNAIGGAVSDLFAADALRTKAKGSRIEAQQYDLAAKFARDNETFTRTSTAIKTYQAGRSIEQTLGQQKADVAAAGFGPGGSALDLLRDSAAQGALHQAVLSQQGAIEEMGYEQQAKSYELMRDASYMAADADEHAATGATWGAALKGIGAIISVIPGFGGGGAPADGPDGGGT